MASSFTSMRSLTTTRVRLPRNDMPRTPSLSCPSPKLSRHRRLKPTRSTIPSSYQRLGILKEATCSRTTCRTMRARRVWKCSTCSASSSRKRHRVGVTSRPSECPWLPFPAAASWFGSYSWRRAHTSRKGTATLVRDSRGQRPSACFISSVKTQLERESWRVRCKKIWTR